MFKNGTKMVNLEAYGTSENILISDSLDQKTKCMRSKRSDFRQLGPVHKGLLSQKPNYLKSELTENGTPFCPVFGTV